MAKESSDLKRAIVQAKARGREAQSIEPRALRAFYAPEYEVVIVQLRNGSLFGFPPRRVQGLEKASLADIARIELSPQGALVMWPALDVQHSVANLASGILGAKWWMREHAARAGRVRSDAKASASKANGAKGGRPRKVVAAAS